MSAPTKVLRVHKDAPETSVVPVDAYLMNEDGTPFTGSGAVAVDASTFLTGDGTSANPLKISLDASTFLPIGLTKHIIEVIEVLLDGGGITESDEYDPLTQLQQLRRYITTIKSMPTGTRG